MSEIIGVLNGIPAPQDRWGDAQAAELGAIDGLVYRSNLLGADRALANRGGGNTSVKETIVDHAGRDTRVLWVKGSGTDLATITAAGFPGLRLDELLLLREREQMSDAEMVDYLLRSAISPDQPRPSIETLLHAFIAAPHVDHTHPDAVIALTSNPGGRELAEKTFGDEAVWLDYERPGFAMSRKIALLLDSDPSAHAVLLEKHGLVTWGETGARRATRQPAPAGPGEMVRAILTSLARKYRLVLEQLQLVTGRHVQVVHAVGGGSRNDQLCRLTADLLAVPVLAGPEEATALGNVLVQARGVGELASLAQMRELVAHEMPITRYEPNGGRSAEETYERLLAITGLASQRPAHATV